VLQAHRPSPDIEAVCRRAMALRYRLLTGMTLREGDPAGWCRRPVTMPQGWDGVHVERLWVRGREATLTAVHGEDRARLDLA
jgi:hypothetical protein